MASAPIKGQSDEPSGLVARTFQLPVTPALWRHAWGETVLWVALPVCCLSLVLNVALGTYRAWEVRGWLVETITGYNERFDTVVYERGTIRITGDRIPRFSEGDVTLLVDPEETVPIEEIRTSQYMVVREDRIVMKRSSRPEEELPLSDIAGLLGEGPVFFDEAGLLEIAERSGPWLQLGVFVLLVVFGCVGDLITRPLYAVIVAAVVQPWLSQTPGGDLGAAFRVALATSSTTLLVALVLDLGGTGPGCSGPILWPAIMLGLTMWAVHGVRRHES